MPFLLILAAQGIQTSVYRYTVWLSGMGLVLLMAVYIGIKYVP